MRYKWTAFLSRNWFHKKTPTQPHKSPQWHKPILLLKDQTLQSSKRSLCEVFVSFALSPIQNILPPVHHLRSLIFTFWLLDDYNDPPEVACDGNMSKYHPKHLYQPEGHHTHQSFLNSCLSTGQSALRWEKMEPGLCKVQDTDFTLGAYYWKWTVLKGKRKWKKKKKSWRKSQQCYLTAGSRSIRDSWVCPTVGECCWTHPWAL